MKEFIRKGHPLGICSSIKLFEQSYRSFRSINCTSNRRIQKELQKQGDKKQRQYGFTHRLKKYARP